MAKALRGPAGRKKIAEMAATTAPALDVDEQTAIEEAQQEFEQLVARQLAGIDEYEPAATFLAFALPDLQCRFEAARQLHEQHDAAERWRASRPSSAGPML